MMRREETIISAFDCVCTTTPGYSELGEGQNRMSGVQMLQWQEKLQDKDQRTPRLLLFEFPRLLTKC